MPDEIRPTIPSSGPEFTPSAPSKKTSTIVKIVVALVVLGFIVSGGALYARVWDPVWNPFRPAPAEVIEKMRMKMEEVKTSHSKVSLSLKSELDKGEEIISPLPEVKAFMVINSDLDITDPDSPETTTIFEVNGEITNQGRFSLRAETKTVANVSYIKINIPDYLSPYFKRTGIDLNKVNNRWIKIEEDSFGNLQGIYPIPQQKSQQELRQKFKKLFEENKIYYVKKELPDQEINGKRMYHYILTLDREKLKELIPEIFKISMENSSQSLPSNFQLMNSFLVGKITESIDEFLEKIGEISFDVWIDKKDLYLYKLKGKKEIDITELTQGKTTGKLTLGIEINYSQFNQEMKVEPPEESIPLQELLPEKSVINLPYQVSPPSGFQQQEIIPPTF